MEDANREERGDEERNSASAPARNNMDILRRPSVQDPTKPRFSEANSSPNENYSRRLTSLQDKQSCTSFVIQFNVDRNKLLMACIEIAPCSDDRLCGCVMFDHLEIEASSTLLMEFINGTSVLYQYIYIMLILMVWHSAFVCSIYLN